MTRNKEYRDTRFRFDKYARLFRDSRYKIRLEQRNE